MANEAQRINNPTSTPETVSDGYQAQNTRFISQSNGVDLTVVEGGTGQCVLKISGPVDVNGTLYAIGSDVTFALSTAGQYLIYLDGTVANLTPTITQTPGDFDPSKNAHYTGGGYRILNWIITYDGTTAIAQRFNDEFVERLTANGTWTCLADGVYEIEMQAKGGDGGELVSTVVTSSGGGGGSGAYGKIRKYIEAGDIWTSVFSAVSLGDCTFGDGVTTLTVQNGGDGEDATTILNYGDGGVGGSLPSGFDFSIEGQGGSYGLWSADGGDAVIGSCGKGGRNSSGSSHSVGEDGVGYGSGGGGSYAIGGGIASAGIGAPAIFIIKKVG